MKSILKRNLNLESDHFDGKLFSNQEPGRRSFKDFFRWMLNRKPARWPKWIERKGGEPPPERVAKGEILVTFIHHSSFLIQIDGWNILTDPIWSKRCSPLPWLFGPTSVHPPGVNWHELPPIDMVLVSHNHYDHLDIPTLRRLSRDHNPISITAKGNARLLRRAGLKLVSELDWWQDVVLPGDLQVTLVPSRHTSGRFIWDQDKTLWGGFLIKTSWGDVYYAGDTAYGKHFRQIRTLYGAPRLAFLPIGCYLPYDFMSPVHMSPYEAVEAHIELGAKTSIGMHFGTFHLSDEAIDDPVKELSRALDHFGLPQTQFIALREGRGWKE
jgi:L-ascorbate metabolism protein UlaG (beta-lactamase superfamily)